MRDVAWHGDDVAERQWQDAFSWHVVVNEWDVVAVATLGPLLLLRLEEHATLVAWDESRPYAQL